MNGRDPNEVMFSTTDCFDTGPYCGGRGHVVVKMTAVEK
jgi:predicted transcriptional regulator of viral defense system